jgi:UDP-N-acetylmuramate dehydrogenase
VIGRGSNLLVRDGGIRGVVAHPGGGDFDKIEVSGNEITAGVGVKLKQVPMRERPPGWGDLNGWKGFQGRWAARYG